jgi:hypothetical protein
MDWVGCVSCPRVDEGNPAANFEAIVGTRSRAKLANQMGDVSIGAAHDAG